MLQFFCRLFGDGKYFLTILKSSQCLKILFGGTAKKISSQWRTESPPVLEALVFRYGILPCNTIIFTENSLYLCLYDQDADQICSAESQKSEARACTGWRNTNLPQEGCNISLYNRTWNALEVLSRKEDAFASTLQHSLFSELLVL